MTVKKQKSRRFCGILFHQEEDGMWRTPAFGGVLIVRCNQSNIERWSVEEHPDGPRFRGSGRNIRECLESSGLVEPK